MLNCKDASHLQSQSYERPLSAAELIGLKLHLLICKGCRGFAQHLRMIHQACRRIDESQGVRANAPELPPDAKTRILKELASKQGKNS
ncbi:MAG: zf-HC2 domain-containing protein [Burkholderiales bacterium]|nr:zf-HC2 domain-containing protein [Burkholderiales bacterium]